jgi:ADP-ribosylation factor GTPase-activating protein 1
MTALSKGWSLFSSAVVGASRVVNENVIQPGMEKVRDPNLQASVRGYVSEAQRKATIAGASANQWSKNTFGVDVAEQVGGVVDTVKDKLGAGPAAAGYGSLRLEPEGDSLSPLYYEGDSFMGGSGRQPEQHSPVQSLSMSSAAKKDDWDDWRDF